MKILKLKFYRKTTFNITLQCMKFFIMCVFFIVGHILDIDNFP